MPPEGFSVTDLNEPPARTAVLTMELQRGVVGDLATMVELREAVAESGLLETVRSMLEAARAAEIPVVHATVSWRADRRGTPLNTPLARHLANNPHQVLEGTPAVELDPRIGAVPSRDLVSHRHHGMTPFTGTSLDSLLRSLGVDHLVICGVSLNVGVLGAVIEAVGLGYEVTIPTDAVVGSPADYAAGVLRNSLAPLAILVSSEALCLQLDQYRAVRTSEWDSSVHTIE